MDYRKFGSTILARIDRGEEIMAQLEKIACAEQIKLAHINALGAVNEMTVGVYSVEKQSYAKNTFTGDLEIVSLHGTITTKEGAYYPHLHMSAGDKDGHVFGGHLNRAVVCGTCEMVITLLDGTVERKIDTEYGSGLNIFSFQ